MDPTIIISLCIAGAVTGVMFFILRLLAGDKDTKLINRLSAKQSVDSKAESIARENQKRGIAPLLQRIGQAAAQPFTPKDRVKQSKQRRLLGNAGIYAPAAVKVVNGAKVILLGLFLAGAYGASIALDTTLNMTVLLVSTGGLLGYLGPTIWLKLKIKANQRALTYGLPDALDLMVVCVESGLTVDGAMQRVGSELGLAHPALSRELAIAHMETRVGLSRSEAMRNLGNRTGCAGLIQLSFDADSGRSIRHEHRPGPARAGRYAAKPASSGRRRNARPKPA